MEDIDRIGLAIRDKKAAGVKDKATLQVWGVGFWRGVQGCGVRVALV